MYDSGVEFWGDNPPFRTPVFVLTNRPAPTLVKEGGTSFTFVTDGIHSALDQAKAAAGGRNVDIAGGADTVQQYLRARLVDELQLHVLPVLFGAGLRLFDNLGLGAPPSNRSAWWTPPAPGLGTRDTGHPGHGPRTGHPRGRPGARLCERGRGHVERQHVHPAGDTLTTLTVRESAPASAPRAPPAGATRRRGRRSTGSRGPHARRRIP